MDGNNNLLRTEVDAHRLHALDQAIRSLALNETPPGDDAIVTRAEKFLTFLDGKN